MRVRLKVFTDEAAELIKKMTANGWTVKYLRRNGFVSFDEWEFSKECDGNPGCGKFWRIGTGADIQAAAEKALAEERGAP